MHDVSHLLQNYINSAAVCNTHNTSLVVWICCTRKPTQLQNSSKVHHSAVCVQPQIKHVWLTTRWLQHPSSTNQIHLPPVCQSDTVLVSVIMWNIKRHISTSLQKSEAHSTDEPQPDLRTITCLWLISSTEMTGGRVPYCVTSSGDERHVQLRENDDTVSSTLNVKENCVHWMKVQMKSERSFITSSSVWAQISWGEYRPQVSNNCFFRLMLKHHLNTPVTNQWSAHVSGLSLNLLCKSKEK